MIPYVTLPPLIVGSVVIQPFALLVSLGVLVAHFLLLGRAARQALVRSWAAELSLTMVTLGLAGSVLFKLLYRPDLLADVGCAGALRYLPGISSFGGLFGALGGAWLYLAWRRIRGQDRLRYLDLVGFAFPFGFAFGRLGCALVHDHPGRRAEGWLTVAYPDGARYDLGLLELLFLISVCGLFKWLDRHPRRPGFFLATVLLIYGPFRVALDRLHVDPPRYGGLPVDVWAGVTVFSLGLYFWRRSQAPMPL